MQGGRCEVREPNRTVKEIPRQYTRLLEQAAAARAKYDASRKIRSTARRNSAKSQNQESKLDDSSILYRHFDAHGRLLYVGVAVNPKERLREHARDGASWVSEVVSSTYERRRTHREVLEAEIAAIKNEAPLWNIAHANAQRVRTLRPVRATTRAENILRCSMPAEPCFARSGVLVSFRTQGRANHVDYKRLKDPGCPPNYHAVVRWMEWFGYHYGHGCISSEDGSFCAAWDDVLGIVDDDWHFEFVVRPKLGLESDLAKITRPLWTT